MGDFAGTTGDRRGAQATDLRADLPGIIAEWERLSREEPWHVEPHRYGVDTLHEAVGAVLDVATWSGADVSAHERLVRAASAHGDQRRAQGAGDDAVLREYHALRAAIWRFLQRSAIPAAETLAAVVRVDVAIGVATTAALRGYHRRDAPVGAGWEADLLRQIADASRRLVDVLGDAPRS